MTFDDAVSGFTQFNINSLLAIKGKKKDVMVPYF